ncbi:MAG: TonB-dependent receptor [Bacteroidota bacterium]
MKISVFLLFTGFMFIYAESSYSQETRLSMHMNEKTVGEVLLNIEQQSEYYFLYSNKLIDVNRRVTLQVKNKPIEQVLDQLFAGTDVRHVVIDRQIILSPAQIMEQKSDKEKLQLQDQIRITGIVTDQNGEPLPGVNITIKGTQKGTISDVSGKFEVFVENQDDILEYSYIGFLTQEIAVGTNITINVQLEEDIHGIEEVVIVGYGTQKKINLTGAVDVVSGEDLINRPAENVGQLLQGTAPNLNIGVSRDGGEPGAAQSWSIRGLGTLSGSSSPLILVDGVEMDVNTLNPESIESVSILKDAAASAIYGARAPFGVVLITTKKGGKNQKIKLNYNNNFGFASPIGLPHFESSIKLATAFNQGMDNSGLAHKFPDAQMDRIQGYIEGTYLPEYDTAVPYDYIWGGRHYGNANYEWMSMYWKKNSPRQKHDISLEGGDGKTQYYVSAGLYDQDGLYNYGYDLYKRYNIIANITSQITKWARFDFSSKYSQVQTDYPLGMVGLDRYYMLRSMPTFWPTMPMYNEGVDPNDQLRAINNPVIRIMEGAGRDKTTNQDSWITLGTEIEPVKGWKTYLSYNYNYLAQRHTTNPISVPVYMPDGNIGEIGEVPDGFTTGVDNNSYSLFNAKTSYERTFGNHFIMAMLGYEQESAFYSFLYGSRRELITTTVPSISTALGESVLNDAMSHWATQAVFSRISYNYKEKYLLEFNGRYNGSSRFGPEHRWGFFPSVGVGYNVYKEEFWASIKPYINSLKIRGSYGSLGNQNVPNYLYLSNIPVGSNLAYVMGDDRPLYAQAPGIVSGSLTWETVTTLNLGIDAGFLNNRLIATFEAYKRNTSDMFGPAENLPEILGTSPPLENNAEMETKGWELSMAWKDRISADFSYHLNVFIGDSKSTVLEYKNEDGTLDDWYNDKQIGEIWGYTTDGLIQDVDEEMPNQSKFYSKWGPGDMKYTDLDGNDTINDGSRTLDDHGDLTVIGNSLPRYNYGISAGVNWKGFDMNMFWQGVGKRDYFPTYIDWSSANFWGMIGDVNGSSIFKEGHLDYWRPADETNILGPNTDAYYAKPYISAENVKNRQVQTKYLLNAAYVRLKSLQIGYTIPGELTNKVHVQKLRVYFSGENLLTFTKLTKLLDPETSVVSGTDIGGRNGIGRVYPLSRVISFGLNVTF